MKKQQTHYSVLKTIFMKYVCHIHAVRKMIFIVLTMIVISRYAEIKLLEYTELISSYIVLNDEHKQFVSLTYFLVISIFFTCLYEFSGFVFVEPIQIAYRSASRDFFSQYLSYEYIEFTRIGSGEIHSNIERKSKAVSDIIEVTVLDIFPIGITFICVIYKIAATISILPAFIMGMSLVIYCYVTFKIAQQRIAIRKNVNKSINMQSNILYDSVQNFESILAYCNNDLEVNRYDAKLAETGVYYTKLYRILYILNFLQKLILIIQLFLILLSGIYGFFMDKFSSKTYFIYIGLVRILERSVYKAGYLYSKYNTAIINYMAEIPTSNKRIGTRTFKFNTQIKMTDLCIYHGDKVILHNINIDIQKGQKIAIVGRNGVGKSSLMKVLLGFVEYRGDLQIDNIQMHDINMNSIRSKIGYIHQDSALFNDTVMYNIKYGNRFLDQNQVLDICKDIGVHESMIRLRDGYNTIAGERGMFLSGGEKQKVAFARVAVKNADILLLDEPTASLDKEAELELIEKILLFYKSKTILMIVHNLSLLNKFNRIMFMENSTCTEIGSHDDLMTLKGGYYRFIIETTITDNCI